jgi:predicted DNA-binding transcriptional regulator YafY
VSTTEKTQRLIDVTVTLLAHRFPCTFDELAKGVPAYAGALSGDPRTRDSVKRAFERDKKELRDAGIPLLTRGDEGSEDVAYSIAARDFYLPYLELVAEGVTQGPTLGKPEGYRSLPTLAFAPDELEVIADAAAKARQMGNDVLAGDAEAATRKLAFDLPLDAVQSGDARLLPPRAAADPATLQRLGAALIQRKRVTIQYRGMSDDALTARLVEPYGLAFLGGHWYLVARDVGREALRNFRVSRIGGAVPNASKAGTADYAIPPSFRLREHAQSRQSWEIGDGSASTAVVEFEGWGVRSGGGLGEAIEGEASHPGRVRRRFTVRRLDAFVRWLLSFAGAAHPVAPPELVVEFARQREATLALYADCVATAEGAR